MDHEKEDNKSSRRHESQDPDLLRIQKMNDEVDLVGKFDALVKGLETSVRNTVFTLVSKIRSSLSGTSPESSKGKDAQIIPFPDKPQKPQRPAKRPKRRAA